MSEIDGGDGYGVHTAVYLADDGVVAIDRGEIERDVVMASNGDMVMAGSLHFARKPHGDGK